jgi:hypothetical protein
MDALVDTSGVSGVSGRFWYDSGSPHSPRYSRLREMAGSLHVAVAVAGSGEVCRGWASAERIKMRPERRGTRARDWFPFQDKSNCRTTQIIFGEVLIGGLVKGKRLANAVVPQPPHLHPAIFNLAPCSSTLPHTLE